MKFNKKGAMEMSINLIIIIIVALTVMGLILGFVVSKFGEADTQFNIEERLQDADYRTPITFSGGDLILQPNRPTAKRISVYNYDTKDINLTKGLAGESNHNLSFNCLPSAGKVIVDDVLDYTFKTGSTDTTQVTLRATGPRDTYACKAMIKGHDGKTIIASDIRVVIR